MRPRYLSKSRFKLGYECPTKLFYTGKKEYYDESGDDTFLANLAKGGYQVGELAKLYHHPGVEVFERDYDRAHEVTKGLIEGSDPAIFEGSIRFQNLFVKIDVLKRVGKNSFDLIEVKSKSFSPSEDGFWNKVKLKKGIKILLSEWEPYLMDVAFQTYVARSAFPGLNFVPYLMLADSSKVASIDGLNQLFPIHTDQKGNTVIGSPKNKNPQELGDPILVKIDVSDEVEWIFNEFRTKPDGVGFKDLIEHLATAYETDQKIKPEPASHCKGCQFRANPDQRKAGFKSGFHECWIQAFNTDHQTLEQDLVFDLSHPGNVDHLIHSGTILLKDMPESHIQLKESEEGGLTQSERRMLQLKKVKEVDQSVYADLDSLKDEIGSWNYPLHFIDFETMTSAIPFHKGQRPYESIAFQFSHHKMERDGSYHHADEFIYKVAGGFPNFEFVRALKKAVSGSIGTIFRYSPHENTTLNHIRNQLLASNESDRDELIEFIETITEEKEAPGKKTLKRQGARSMVDLYKLLLKYYYDPATHGSNSLKYVYPAVLRRSRLLQEKYSKPIYGSASSIKSHNFKNKVWVTRDEKGEIINPYDTLPSIFGDVDLSQLRRFFTSEELKEGGTASAAYARMQFQEMSESERVAIQNALLRYCELDTLAMVMLVEHWMELVP